MGGEGTRQSAGSGGPGGLTAAYAREAEEFLAALEEECYRNEAGLQETLDLAPLYARHAPLFSADRVHELLAQRETKEGRFLAQFAVQHHLERQVCDLTEAIAAAETRAVVDWQGERLPFRAAAGRVPHETDRGRRRALDDRIGAVVAESNPLRCARVSALHEAARGLGSASYRALCDTLSGLNLEGVRTSVEALLAATEARWQELLSEHLARLGLPAAEAHVSDLRHALTAPQFEACFPGSALLPAVYRTAAGLGIDLGALTNLGLDVEDRPHKSPRACCYRVRVPSDIRLLTLPRGGRDDYNHLLHEMGHALHFALTDPAAPVAYRLLGDNSVAEAYAFLLNLLLRNPAWLSEVAGLTVGEGYLRFAAFYQLCYVRRLAAKVGYEVELHDVGPIDEHWAAEYAARQSRTLAVEVSPQFFLADVDDGLYCACYLRAWMLEVQLRRRLEERFGASWFTRPAAGDFLRDLWRLGQELTAEELAARLGYPGLQVEPLIADLLSPL